MSGLQGHVLATYDDIVATFGKRNGTCLDSRAEWNVIIDGHEISIYCLKKYTNKIPRCAYPWHIGGESPVDAQMVADKLGGRPTWGQNTPIVGASFDEYCHAVYAHYLTLGGMKTYEQFNRGRAEERYSDIIL
eukprot:TRINITY_DN8231_c0_g2_i1.p3 TRINITY_DN8231_c0_g2~~TRINITY_DN8231_c0_g2_i1.p3  ORF type:complete len:133 (-),score=8.63 TRINITY_DN8231_c0_g2_i1:292-690(-)